MIGVLQCLETANFINKLNKTFNVILVSSLLRTQQTFYLSFLSRLPRTKVLVVDQLNERRFHPWFDAHNFEVSRRDTKERFKGFIKKLNGIDWKRYVGKTLKFPERKWNDLFEDYQYHGGFWEMIKELTEEIEGEVNIYCVSSHHRIESLIKEKYPDVSFLGNQVVNCEIIKVGEKVERLWPHQKEKMLVYFEPWRRFLFLPEYMKQDVKGKQNYPLKKIKKYDWKKVKKYLEFNKKYFKESLINYDFYLKQNKIREASNQEIINFLFMFGSPETKKIEYEFKEKSL